MRHARKNKHRGGLRVAIAVRAVIERGMTMKASAAGNKENNRESGGAGIVSGGRGSWRG